MHDGRQAPCVDVVGAVVERANLTVIAAGVVDADERAVGDEKLIELLLDLVVRQRLRLPRRLGCRVAAAAAACAAAAAGALDSTARSTSASSRRSAGGLNVTEHLLRRADQNDLSLDAPLELVEIRGRARPGRPLRQRQLQRLSARDAVGARRPRQRFARRARPSRVKRCARRAARSASPGRPEVPRLQVAVLIPHACICSMAHSPAALRFGEPVSRGP